MKRGYIRLGVTLPEETAQRRALASAGVDMAEGGPVYCDAAPKRRDKGKPDLPERERAIRSLRKGGGDELVVAEEGVLGLDADDLNRVLQVVTERGAVVTVVAAAKSYRWSPELPEALAFIREAVHQHGKWRAANARRHGKPRQKVLRGASKDAAKVDWFNPILSAEEVATKWEVGVRTLYNLFGARGTPPFGARVKGRRR